MCNAYHCNEPIDVLKNLTVTLLPYNVQLPLLLDQENVALSLTWSGANTGRPPPSATATRLL